DLGFCVGEPPVIFDGNSLADISQNNALDEILKKRGVGVKKNETSAWVGEPIEMKISTAAVFKRQSRSNLLMLAPGEYEQTCAAMILTSIISIAIQRPPPAAQFVVFNFADTEADWIPLLDKCKTSLPHEI